MTSIIKGDSEIIYHLVMQYRSELAQELRDLFMSLVFDNRSNFHPRRLKEAAEYEVESFLTFLSLRDLSAVKEHGKSRIREGLGEKTILALGNILYKFCWEHIPADNLTLLRTALDSVAKYIAAYCEGYMAEREAEILKDQEQLRRALSAALERQSRELLIKNHAINTSINGIMLTDLEGQVNYVNPAFLNIWGYEDSLEVMGKNSFDFLKDEEVQKNIRILVEQNGGGWRRELTAQRKDGSLYDLEISASLIKDAKGQPIGIMVSFIDITERKKSEFELRKLEEHLFQAQKMEAIGTLASGIAHDFNNILQAISGYIQIVLQKGELDITNQKHLSEVDFAIERASDLVHRLLTFSRKVKPELKLVDLNKEVVHAVKMLERAIPKMISIEMHLSGDLRLVNGDENQLEQVLMNLGANARDAMPEGGRLVIETANVTLDEEFCKANLEVEPGAYALLKVSDTGHGMEPETSSHIFEPFFTTKGVGKGTGLGLSTVYGIVKGHGGHITCLSQPWQGTTFNIYLPASRDKEDQLVAESKPQERVSGGHETILLVDDEKAILEVARDTLQEHGYKTILAESGEQVLDIYQSEGRGIDLIILDLGMPGMGGQVCLKELLKINPLAKVIIASGYSADAQVKEGLDSGARDFIGKPYRLMDLLGKVRQVLDNEDSSSSDFDPL